MNPAFNRIEAAEVAFIVEIFESARKERAEASLAEERRLEVAFGESGEAQRGKRSQEDGVGTRFADADTKIGLPLVKERDQVRGREFILPDDPDVEDGIGEVVAEFRIRGREVGAEFGRESGCGLIWRNGVVIFGEVSPELAVMDGSWRLRRRSGDGRFRKSGGQDDDRKRQADPIHVSGSQAEDVYRGVRRTKSENDYRRDGEEETQSSQRILA